MKYKCNCCSYETSQKCNLDKHFTTNKHKTNVELHAKLTAKIPEVDPAKRPLTCDFCNVVFSQISSLSRHKKTCSQKAQWVQEYEQKMSELKRACEERIREYTTRCEILEEKVTSRDREIENLRAYIDSFRNIAEGATEVSRVSSNALSYIVATFKNSPQFLTFANVQIIKTPEEMIYYYEKALLAKYVGDLIVQEYKKNNPEDQAMWNSDTSRQSYIVRDMSGESLEWLPDKKGIKVSRYAIHPILDHIKDAMKNYVLTMNEKMRDCISEIDISKHLTMMNVANSLITDIETGALDREVHKYIGSHFYLDKNRYIKKIVPSVPLLTVPHDGQEID